MLAGSPSPLTLARPGGGNGSRPAGERKGAQSLFRDCRFIASRLNVNHPEGLGLPILPTDILGGILLLVGVFWNVFCEVNDVSIGGLVSDERVTQRNHNISFGRDTAGDAVWRFFRVDGRGLNCWNRNHTSRSCWSAGSTWWHHRLLGQHNQPVSCVSEEVAKFCGSFFAGLGQNHICARLGSA
jgi:hypothetical protein